MSEIDTLEISKADFDKIAKAGQIENGADAFESEILDLRMALDRWASYRKVLIADRVTHLSHNKQKELLEGFSLLSEQLAEYVDQHPEMLNLLIGLEQRRVSKERTAESLEHALACIPRQARQQLAKIGGAKDRVATWSAELEDAPVLPVMSSAAKETSNELALWVLLYLAAHGRLGDKKPGSDTDQRVKFAAAIFEFFERGSRALSAARESDSLTLGAVRRRLAAQFERAQALSGHRPKCLEAERERQAIWLSEVVEELKKIPNVSADEAREFADGMAVDLSVHPREAVRRFVATWNE